MARSSMRIGAAVTIAAALTLAGCSSGGAKDTGATSGTPESEGNMGPITFQTWSLKNEKFTPYFESVITQCEAANPGLEVKWLDQPADGYEDKVLQQAESGELPDVINLPPEYAFTLAKADQLQNLDEVSKVLDEYVPGGVEAYEFDGVEGKFAFPWYLGTELNYWNTALLEEGGVSEVPSTIDEALDAAGKLAKSGIITISDIPSPKSLTSLISDQGGHLQIFEDGKFTFNTPEAAALIERYAELYKEGAVSPEAIQGAGAADNNTNQFAQGTIAWTTAGPNYIEKGLAVDAPTLVPITVPKAGFGNPPLFVQGISVAKNSKNPEAALAFAECLTNNENQIEFVILAPGFFPGTKAANDDPSSFVEASDIETQNEATELAAKQMDRAARTNPPQFTDSMEIYAKQQIALAVKGEISAQEALDKSVQYAQDNLDR